jgi:hypothetical protein
MDTWSPGLCIYVNKSVKTCAHFAKQKGVHERKVYGKLLWEVPVNIWILYACCLAYLMFVCASQAMQNKLTTQPGKVCSTPHNTERCAARHTSRKGVQHATQHGKVCSSPHNTERCAARHTTRKGVQHATQHGKVCSSPHDTERCAARHTTRKGVPRAQNKKKILFFIFILSGGPPPPPPPPFFQIKNYVNRFCSETRNLWECFPSFCTNRHLRHFAFSIICKSILSNLMYILNFIFVSVVIPSSSDSSVGIVTRLRAGRQRIRSILGRCKRSCCYIQYEPTKCIL